MLEIAVWAPTAVSSALALFGAALEFRGTQRSVAIGLTFSVIAISASVLFLAPYEPTLYLTAAAPALVFVALLWFYRERPRRA